MLAVVIYACLIADPETCKSHQIPILSGGDVKRCALFAPIRFADWKSKHPQWQIKKWRCDVYTGPNL